MHCWLILKLWFSHFWYYEHHLYGYCYPCFLTSTQINLGFICGLKLLDHRVFIFSLSRKCQIIFQVIVLELIYIPPSCRCYSFKFLPKYWVWNIQGLFVVFCKILVHMYKYFSPWLLPFLLICNTLCILDLKLLLMFSASNIPVCGLKFFFLKKKEYSQFQVILFIRMSLL